MVDLAMNRIQRAVPRLCGVLVWLLAATAQAEVFPLPPPGDDLVGAMRVVIAEDDDTLVEIARRYGYGYNEIRIANPAVDAWMPRGGTQVVLPGRRLLPSGPRVGLVINVAEMRMYYYPKPKPGEAATVETFPVAVGRGDWSTPVADARIARKTANPTWYPPASIRAEHAADGDMLPTVVGPGPDNPLGKYALYMSLPGYLIHGSNKKYGIGMQVTHGCIRMYHDDIEHLYKAVPVGTPVRIVNQPYKAGWHRGTLFVEVHPLLEGVPDSHHNDKTPLIEALVEATRTRPDYPVDWLRARELDMESTGQPAAVGPEMMLEITDRN